MQQAETLACVPGVSVGHASDPEALTGCTVVACPEGAVPGLVRVGGASGTRQMDGLEPGHVVPRVHGVVLAGGSSLGLGAADGAVEVFQEAGIGLRLAGRVLPILPTAVLFDLRVGRPQPPTRALAAEAARRALAGEPEEPAAGGIGAGTGATVGKLFGIQQAWKSGLASHGVVMPDGLAVAVLAVVNAFGDVRDPVTGRLLAGARLERSGRALADTAARLREFGMPRVGLAGENTTLVVVATNAGLDKVSAKRAAQLVAGSLYRCLSPAGTLADGDLVVVLAAGDAKAEVHRVGLLGAWCLERAVVRAVRSAEGAAGLPGLAGC